MSDSQKPDRQTQVEEQMQVLDDRIEYLREVVCSLQGRLKPLLVEEEPAGSAIEDRDVIVEHADRIRNFRDRVSEIIRVVEGTTGRLEI